MLVLELRAADGSGLEEMFLELTGDTQRETSSAATGSTTQRRSSSMTTIAPEGPTTSPATRAPDLTAGAGRRRTRRSAWPGSPASSCARCSTPARGSGCCASIGILSLAATAAVIVFGSAADLTYESFAAAIGFPMAVVLPMIAVLSVTSEWSQRTGLATFTLVAHRGRVIAAKALCAIGVGVVSMLVAAGIGALGNVVGSALAGTETVWNISVGNLAQIVLANVLGMMIGFMLGVLLRSSAAAIVGYFVYSFVLTGLTELLAFNQQWFADIRGWVDFNYSQGSLFEGLVTTQQWAELGVSGLFWLVIPLAVGVRLVLRSEVK